PPLDAVFVHLVAIPRRCAHQIRTRLFARPEALRALGEQPRRADAALGERLRTGVDDHERADAIGIATRKIHRVASAHRVSDDDRALDRVPIQDRERVGHELGRRVAICRPPAFAVPARVRRDQSEASGHRVGDEAPVAPVITDAVEQQHRGLPARPGPVHKLDAVARDRRSVRHAANTLPSVIADLRALVDRRELLADFAWRELRARYKGSVLGFAWNFVNPLLQLLVFWLLFGVVLLFAVLALCGPRHPEGLVWLPLLVALQIVMNLGFAYLLSALSVFFRDVQHILGILLLAWYFLTPVLFPVAVLDDRPQQLFL